MCELKVFSCWKFMNEMCFEIRTVFMSVVDVVFVVVAINRSVNVLIVLR